MKAPTAPTGIEAPDLFELWLLDRPKWLQTAARQLIDNKRRLSEDEIATLAKLCRDEAAGVTGLVFACPQPGTLSVGTDRSRLRIDGLADVRGVNAIRDGAVLAFGGTNITVIYGPNGSGKTSFSRVLKHACGSRAKEDLHSNVFAKEVQLCAAQILVSVGDVQHTLDWTANGDALKQLRDIHVFDSKSAGIYVGLPNEATYEPRRMRFLSSLVAICDRVAACIDAEKKSLVKKLPAFPPEFTATATSKWLGALRSTTAQADIDKSCGYPKALDDERVAAEAALAEKDIAARLVTLQMERAAITKVRTSFARLKDALADTALEALVNARRHAQEKRQIASDMASKAFDKAPLEGVGQAAWLALWEHARKYSELYAYPGTLFPVVGEGSLCVLCQQRIDNDGAQRLSHFEAFVKGGLEVDAKTAEKHLDELRNKLPTLPSLNDWIIQASVLKIEEEAATASYAALQARRLAADVAAQAVEIPSFDWMPIETAVAVVDETHSTEEKSLKALQQDGKRKELEMRVVQLKSIQWLSQNKQAISDEVSRLKSLALLEKAGSLARTNALTAKKNELAKHELDTGYQTRFANELELLGGKRIQVYPESRQEGKGKISFVLALRGARRAIDARQVLSEGETRIVALAAFLADITGSGEPTPFIFDDPISSLDQHFEERVVARLLDLSRTRQVVVFTHRLSLLTLIEGAIEHQAKLDKAANPVTLHVQAVHRLGNTAGIVHQLNIRGARPQKAANRLRDEVVPQLRKLFDNGDVLAYEIQAKSVCTDFRVLVECCVEKVLCNDIVQRYRRSVETKGKIGALAKIEFQDCVFIDTLMTRYSAFEHSQPDELPAELPNLDGLQKDITDLAEWIANFDKRAVK